MLNTSVSARNVLMLVENLPVPLDRRVWMECRTLAEAGYNVVVICPRGNAGTCHEYLEGIHIYRYPLPSMSGFVGHLLEYGIALCATFLLSIVVLARHGFDVIHAANPPDLFFLLALCYKPLGKKFVFDHHDLVPETCVTRWSGWKGKLIYRAALLQEWATFACADVVISTNESYKTVAVQRGGVAPDRVVVVRSGPSQSRFAPVPPQPRLRCEATYLVVYLGVMGPNDGIDLLLDVASLVVHKHGRRDVRFVLIGSGDCYESSVARSQVLQLHGAVAFTGRIPDEEVIAFLATADVGIAPDPKDALNDLSTMNKIVEYMAMGVPVLSFDLHEARVSAGEAAWYARATDASHMAELLVSLLNAPDRREGMARAGRERFLNSLSWEHQAPKLLDAYRRIPEMAGARQSQEQSSS